MSSAALSPAAVGAGLLAVSPAVLAWLSWSKMVQALDRIRDPGFADVYKQLEEADGPEEEEEEEEAGGQAVGIAHHGPGSATPRFSHR